MLDQTDTIVAVSSPPGRCWRGLIRVSGSRSRVLLEGLATSQSPAWEIQPRTLTRLRLAWHHGAEAIRALPALAAWFPAPRSYTGEDLVELQVTGNPSILEGALRRLVRAGARVAEPGEFTYRAFRAGRLDLTQAEGVSATIAAVSDAELQAATTLRRGRLGKAAAAWVESLANALALVEAGIDFADQDDVVAITSPELLGRLRPLQAELAAMLTAARPWSEVGNVPRVVLVGRPSVGKSTLFNALLGRERAITSPMPGTTRDVLSEPLTLAASNGRRIEILLQDVAGLDSAVGALDRAAQQAARDAIHRADLLLRLTEPGSPCHTWPPTSNGDADVLLVQAKSDLAVLTPPPREQVGAPGLAVSAHTGQGLAALREAIANHLLRSEQPRDSAAMALMPRHQLAMDAADLCLKDVVEDLPHADGPLPRAEVIAALLRQALDHLAELGGTVTADDVIGRVFATFCIGK